MGSLGIFPFVQLVTDYTDYTDYFNDIMTCLGMKKLFFSHFFLKTITDSAREGSLRNENL